MSKATKFYSLGIDIFKELDTDEFEDSNADFVKRRIYLNADMMEAALKKLTSYLGDKGEEFDNAPLTEEIPVKIAVSCEGKPTTCEVRFFPILEGDKFVTDYEPTGRIDMYRYVTGEDGVLSAKVPEGKYLLKVSKGSEYEIVYDNISVTEGKNEFGYKIKRFVNLEAEGFYSGDIHHHSIYSSPVWGGTDDVKESPLEVARSMQAMGLTFGALSDHHNILNHKEWKSLKTDEFCPIPSKEISTSNGHVLALGVDEYDVIYKIPDAKDRTEKYLRDEFVRITDEIREKGGLPQLNHPRDLSVSISWNRDFYDMTDIFETMEIWNGSNPMYYGSTDAMAADFWRANLENGLFIPATTGSDTHNIKADDYHRIYGEMLWLKGKAKTALEEVPGLFKEEKTVLESFIYITERILPMLEVWAKTSLTSGCVRTYVHIDGKPDSNKLLQALRSGRSFLTNGPILTMKVNGKEMGETAKAFDGKVDLKVRLLSNRSIDKLTAYLSKNRAVEIPVKNLSKAPSYDYSIEIEDFDIGDSTYLFLVASGGVTNIAITNPVLFA